MRRAPTPASRRSSPSPRSGATRSSRFRRPSGRTRSSPSSPFASRSRPLALAPFAWRPLRALAARRLGGRARAPARFLASAYGLQTAGLELTTVTSTGFITGLYVVFTPLLALAAFRTPVPAPVWVGVVALARRAPAPERRARRLVGSGTCSCSGTPSRSRSRSSRWSGSRRATTRGRSTFLQMAVAFAGFAVIAVAAGQVEAPPDAATWYALVVTGVFAGRARLPRRDMGAVADDRGARGARVHARGAVRRALRRAPPLGAPRAGRLDRLRRDARRASCSPSPRPRRRCADSSPRGRARWTRSSWRSSRRPASARCRSPSASRSSRRSCPPPSARSSCRSRRSRCSASRPRSREASRSPASLPFLLAGAIAPGLSNLFITVGIREAGSSRASVAFGTAPLFAVTIAVLVFGERPGAAVLFGALLIVCGGVALALEPERPRHVRRIGIALRLSSARRSSRCATTSSAICPSTPTSRR